MSRKSYIDTQSGEIVLYQKGGSKEWRIRGETLVIHAKNRTDSRWSYQLSKIYRLKLEQRASDLLLSVTTPESPQIQNGKIPLGEKRNPLLRINTPDLAVVKEALALLKENYRSIQIEDNCVDPASIAPRQGELVLRSARNATEWIVFGGSITIRERRRSIVVPIAQITSINMQRNTISFKTASSNVRSRSSSIAFSAQQPTQRRMMIGDHSISSTTRSQTLPYAELTFKSSDRGLAQSILDHVAEYA